MPEIYLLWFTLNYNLFVLSVSDASGTVRAVSDTSDKVHNKVSQPHVNKSATALVANPGSFGVVPRLNRPNRSKGNKTSTVSERTKDGDDSRPKEMLLISKV